MRRAALFPFLLTGVLASAQAPATPPGPAAEAAVVRFTVDEAVARAIAASPRLAPALGPGGRGRGPGPRRPGRPLATGGPRSRLHPAIGGARARHLRPDQQPGAAGRAHRGLPEHPGQLAPARRPRAASVHRGPHRRADRGDEAGPLGRGRGPPRRPGRPRLRDEERLLVPGDRAREPARPSGDDPRLRRPPPGRPEPGALRHGGPQRGARRAGRARPRRARSACGRRPRRTRPRPTSTGCSTCRPSPVSIRPSRSRPRPSRDPTSRPSWPRPRPGAPSARPSPRAWRRPTRSPGPSAGRGCRRWSSRAATPTRTPTATSCPPPPTGRTRGTWAWASRGACSTAGGAPPNEARARAQADATREQLRELDRGIRLEVTQRALELRTAEARLAVAERSVGSAAESRRVAGDRYREGVIPSSELLDAEVAHERAALARTEALAALRLDRGRPRPGRRTVSMGAR